MNVAKEVTCSNQLNTRLNCRYSHIGKGVVVAVDKNAYRIGLSVSDYVYVVYISIRRAAVGTALDVNTYLGALDRHVADSSLAAAVDRDARRYHTTVNAAALKVVVASGEMDVVKGFRSTESYHSLAVIPAGHCLEDREVGKLECNRVCGISRGSYRICKQIFTVGEIYGLLRVLVYRSLYACRNVLARVGLNVVGNNYVAYLVRIDRVGLFCLRRFSDHRGRKNIALGKLYLSYHSDSVYACRYIFFRELSLFHADYLYVS